MIALASFGKAMAPNDYSVPKGVPHLENYIFNLPNDLNFKHRIEQGINTFAIDRFNRWGN